MTGLRTSTQIIRLGRVAAGCRASVDGMCWTTILRKKEETSLAQVLEPLDEGRVEMFVRDVEELMRAGRPIADELRQRLVQGATWEKRVAVVVALGDQLASTWPLIAALCGTGPLTPTMQRVILGHMPAAPVGLQEVYQAAQTAYQVAGQPEVPARRGHPALAGRWELLGGAGDGARDGRGPARR
jgi:hypothetical protein